MSEPVRTLTAAVLPEDDWYVARCLELPVITQGESEEQAVTNLAEAVALYLEEVPEAQVTTAHVLPFQVPGSAA